MGKPDLVIPVRMDLDNAIKQLQKIAREGKKAGQDMKQGMDVAKGGVEKLHDGMANLSEAQTGMGAIRGLSTSIGQEYAPTADYVRKLASEFTDLRQAMQQVAALKSIQNTNEFTVEAAKKAATASPTPKEWRTLREQFQSYSGAYLESDQVRFVQRGDVSTSEQAEQDQQGIAEFAKARGIGADNTARLATGFLQFSEDPQTTEELISRFGQVFETLKRTFTPVAQLLPPMRRVMAVGASPEDAAQMLRITRKAMADDKEPDAMNPLKAVQNHVLDGKGEALCQKKRMTALKQVKAASATIKGRNEQGEDPDKILHELAPDIREMRTVKDLLTWGLEAGSFEKVQGYVAQIPTDFVQQAVRNYEAGDAGQWAKYYTHEALALAERRAKTQTVDAELKKARIAVMWSGKLEEQMGIGALYSKALGGVSGVSLDDQIINGEAIREVQRCGPETSPVISEETGHSASAEASFREQADVNKEILYLLKQIEAKTRKEPPLAAPPATVFEPRPAVRTEEDSRHRHRRCSALACGFCRWLRLHVPGRDESLSCDLANKVFERIQTRSAEE